MEAEAKKVFSLAQGFSECPRSSLHLSTRGVLRIYKYTLARITDITSLPAYYIRGGIERGLKNPFFPKIES